MDPNTLNEVSAHNMTQKCRYISISDWFSFSIKKKKVVPQDIHENQTKCALKRLVYPVGYNHIQNYVCPASFLLQKTTRVIAPQLASRIQLQVRKH